MLGSENGIDVLEHTVGSQQKWRCIAFLRAVFLRQELRDITDKNEKEETKSTNNTDSQNKNGKTIQGKRNLYDLTIVI